MKTKKCKCICSKDSATLLCTHGNFVMNEKLQKRAKTMILKINRNSLDIKGDKCLINAEISKPKRFMKDEKYKKELIKYIKENPEQRLGQAICNFYHKHGIKFIFTADAPGREIKFGMDLFFHEF